AVRCGASATSTAPAPSAAKNASSCETPRSRGLAIVTSMPPILTALRHDLVTIHSAAMKVLALLLVVLAGAALVYGMVQPWAGAGDNASGIAGLLELARLLRENPPPMRTELVFYPREEVDGMGSEVHARSLTRGEVRAVIVLEMIGTFSGEQKFPFAALKLLYPAEGDYIVVVGRPRDFLLTRTVKRGLASTAIPVESINAPESIPGIGNSDHRNYWLQGM